MPLPFIIAGLAAVGSAVGAAATAVGVTAIGTAAATTTGAAAVGAIATATAVGAVSATGGAVKLNEAKETKQRAEELYQIERDKFDKVEESTNGVLTTLGENKIEIGASFTKFIDIYSKIKNKPDVTQKGAVSEKITLTPDELEKMKTVAITMGDVLKIGVGSVGAGYLVSMGISSAAISAAATATTGVAIGSLSGVAATNATLAAFGGGALSVGGGGMALGASVLSSLTVAPVVAVGGLMLGHKGKKSLDEANKSYDEVKNIVEELKESSKLLRKIRKVSKDLNQEIMKIYEIYNKLIVKMQDVIVNKTDYLSFNNDEKNSFGGLVTTALLLKFLITQNILDDQNNINDNVRLAISDSDNKLVGVKL